MKKTFVKIIAAILVVVIALGTFTACGKTWTCDRCGKTWHGKAYYGSSYDKTLCAECADKYWNPLPFRNYEK